MCIRWPELDGIVFRASPVFLCLSWEVIYTCKDSKFSFKWLRLGLYWSHNALITCCSLYNPRLQFGTATGNCLSCVFNWWKNASTFASGAIRSKFTLNAQIKEIFLTVTAVPLSPLSPRPPPCQNCSRFKILLWLLLVKNSLQREIIKRRKNVIDFPWCCPEQSGVRVLCRLSWGPLPQRWRGSRGSWWYKSVHSPC